MKKIGQILRTTEFESSSEKTQQFKIFVSEFKKEMKKEMKIIDATNIEFSIGHFDITGFFDYKGELYYFSLSDIRGSNYNSTFSLLYRTAKHRKDWTGGSNQWVIIDENMGKKMFNLAH